MNSLPEQDALVVFAEVAVAVVGFSGVMAFVGKPTERVAQIKLKALVSGGVGVLVFSLLPIVVSLTSLEQDTAWRSLSGLMLAWIVIYYVLDRHDLALIGSDTVGPLLYAVGAGDLIMVVALVASTLGVPLLGHSFIYLASLLWMLVQVLSFFVESMAGLWSRSP